MPNNELYDPTIAIASLKLDLKQLFDVLNHTDCDKRKLAIAKTNFQQAILWLEDSLNGETDE